MKRVQNIIEIMCKKGIKTPFYCFDEEGFRRNYNDLMSAFRDIYPRYEISYSYKTNYTPYICNVVKSLDGYAEVVSDMEYDLAKKIGYTDDKIVFNGPSKGERLETHIANGGILNIDNYAEALRVFNFAEHNPRTQFKVGLRINMSNVGGFISRFGFEIDSEDLEKTVNLFMKSKNITITGLHCHISRARGLDAWKKRIDIMLEAADQLIEGIPEYISLGSGMYASMEDELKKQFGNYVPSYQDYANVIIEPIAKHYKNISDNRKPVLFTEPGTTVVSRYLYFVTKVLNIKTICGRRMATVDGSYLNLGEICTMKELPVDVIQMAGKESNRSAPTDIMGFTCLEQDLMLRGCSQAICENDIVVFHNCGGYSVVSKPQFIKPNCAMYAVTSNSGVQEIMREETFEDVFSKFLF